MCCGKQIDVEIERHRGKHSKEAYQTHFRKFPNGQEDLSSWRTVTFKEPCSVSYLNAGIMRHQQPTVVRLFSSGKARFTFKKFQKCDNNYMDESSTSTLIRQDAIITDAVDSLSLVNTAADIRVGEEWSSKMSGVGAKIARLFLNQKD